MNDNETIADIIAMLRANARGDRFDCFSFTSLADRLEAAHKRELGNCAKLRGALVCAIQALDVAARNTRGETGMVVGSCYSEAARKCRAALSEPVRNCEVGTAMEQGERFSAYCREHKHPKSECLSCPLFGQTGGYCELAWAQIPYMEGGEK